MDIEKKITTMKLIFAVVGIALMITGCAGNAVKYGAAKISTSPEGAEVVNLKDDSNLGMTPVNVSFPGQADTSEYITVQLRKPGYLDRITSFWINKRHKTQQAADDNAIDILIELEKKAGN